MRTEFKTKVFIALLISVISSGAELSGDEVNWVQGDCNPEEYIVRNPQGAGIIILISSEWSGMINQSYKKVITSERDHSLRLVSKFVEYDVSSKTQEGYVKKILKELGINYEPVILFSIDGKDWNLTKSPNDLANAKFGLHYNLVEELRRICNSSPPRSVNKMRSKESKSPSHREGKD